MRTPALGVSQAVAAASSNSLNRSSAASFAVDGHTHRLEHIEKHLGIGTTPN
jgi:hypothetical protein